MANVTYQRPDYTASLPTWRKADDVVSGAKAVKAGGTRYLPRTNPSDTSPEADARYEAYKQRATFVPITGRTLKSLIGAAFRKDPELEVPSSLDYVKDDIDGAGISIYQQSQAVVGDVLAKGRAFLLVDYPQSEGGASVADMASLRATVTRYSPESVINWRISKTGAKTVLSLVVIKEQVEVVSGFEVEIEYRYRVLELIDGVYTVTIYDEEGISIAEPVQPRDASGALWNEIPGTFVGAENNDTEIDQGPLADLIDLNVDHYQVYADWRKVLFLAANPQPVVSGLDPEWRDWMESKGMMVGSDVTMLLPATGAFQWAQINSQQPLREELNLMQQQMVAMGARLLEKGGAVMTATQARAENAAEYSVLALVAANVSEAYTKCLQWLGRFMGDSGSVMYDISREYAEAELDPAMLAAVVSAWQSGTVAKSDARAYMRKVGFIDSARTDEEIEAEVQGETQGLDLNADPVA